MFDDDTVAGSWSALRSRLESGTLRRWSRAEPALRGLGTCAQLVEVLDGPDRPRSDATLQALVGLAAVDGPREDDALLLMLHLLSPGLRALATSLADLSPDVLALAVGEMACQLRLFAGRGRSGGCAANLLCDTRKALLAELRPEVRDHPERGEDLTWDGSCRGLDRPVPGPYEEPGLDPVDMLGWAVRRGIDAADVRLLVATECARASCVRRADHIVAKEYGISDRALYRRRNRVLAALRAVAPAYLAAVA